MKQISTLTLNVRELLTYTDLQYMLDTLNENPKLGCFFVDDEVTPNSCIIRFNHWLFFGGNPSEDCLRFLSSEIITDAVRDSGHVFYMLYPDEACKNALMELFSDHFNQYERSLYRIKPEYIHKMPQHETIVEITPELMNSTTENLEMITNEILPTGTYDSMQDFFTRGFGYTPVIHNKVCGFCTSEYPSKGAIAIGIEVLEEHQRQSYAKTMTKAFLNKAAQKGLTVYWECWKNNFASSNTALSCGFEKVADYPILFVRF